MIDWLGWIATALFVASYFSASPTALPALQMFGAALWATYGVLIGAPPLIAVNVLVFAAAGWTAVRVFMSDRERTRYLTKSRSP